MGDHEKLVDAIRKAGEDLPYDLETFVWGFLFYYQQSFVRAEQVYGQLRELSDVITGWVRRKGTGILLENQIQESGNIFLDMVATAADYALQGMSIQRALGKTLEVGQKGAVGNPGPIQTLYRTATNYSPRETTYDFGQFLSKLN